MTKKFYFFLVTIIIFLNSCSRNPFEIQTDGVAVNLNFVNLDSLINVSDSTNLVDRIYKQKEFDYDALIYFLSYCLNTGDQLDSATLSNLMKFKQDPFVKRLESEIALELYPKMGKLNQDIMSAFTRLKVFVPASELPKTITYMNSMYQASAIATMEGVAVGLDRYLGEESPALKEVPRDYIYQWERERMLDKYLVRDVLLSWLSSKYLDSGSGSDRSIAEEMVLWGKVLYLAEGCLNVKDPGVALRYSPIQLSWANEHHANFWSHLTENKLLFSKEVKLKMNYFQDAPFTAGLDENGPDRMGQFLGWKMVHDFMESNSKLSLQELMEVPYNKIMQAYKN